jgi:cysteinyl-tRNA synthetase
MSLFQEPPDSFLKQLDDIFLRKNNINKEEINNLVEERNQARKNKNFKKADEIRKKLVEMNIEVQDSPTGTTWETKKTDFLP